MYTVYTVAKNTFKRQPPNRKALTGRSKSHRAGRRTAPPPPRVVAMHKHLARGSEAITLYRRFIELARMFPDPCGRHYLFNRVAHVFRRHRGETSPDAVGKHLSAGRQYVRKLRRALTNKEDYEYVLRHSYGVTGRFKHLLHRAEIEARSPPKTSRLPTTLPPLPGPAKERFTLAELNRILAEEEDGVAPSPEIANSVKTQLAVLRALVPRAWARRAKFQPEGGNAGGGISGWFERATGGDAGPGSERDASGGGESSSSAGGVVLSSATAPRPWEIEGEDDVEIGGAAEGGEEGGRRGRSPVAYFDGDSVSDWEVNHLALITTTFTPDIKRRVDEGVGMIRSWKRFYKLTLSGGGGVKKRIKPAKKPPAGGEERTPRTVTFAPKKKLRISGIPASWSDAANDDDDAEDASSKRVVLTFGDAVVDEIETGV